MAKSTPSHRKRLRLDDVLAGRGRPPSARELIELIREVNPSGLDLPAAQRARRYAQKSRLQSLLIRRFESDIDVEPDAGDPGVVGLRYRPLEVDACHAVLLKLDADARSWAQRQVDLTALARGPAHERPRAGPPAKGAPRHATSAGDERPAGGLPIAGAERPTAELLRAGQEAIDGELRARIADVLEMRNIERLFREGAWLRALHATGPLLERLQGEERVRMLAVREKLGEAIRHAFRIRVDRTPCPLRSLRDVDLRAIAGAPRALLPDTGELLLVETHGVWVFIRLVDLPSCTIRVRVTLCTPVPVDLLRMEIDAGRMLLAGLIGTVLELSLADWTVVGWHERVSFEMDPKPSARSADDVLPSGRYLDLPPELLRDAALGPGSRVLWCIGTIPGRHSFVRLVDLTGRRVLRAYRGPPDDLSIRTVHGLDSPMMTVLRDSDGNVGFYEPLGAALEGTAVVYKALHDGIVVYPGQQKILIFACDFEKDRANGIPARLIWMTLTPHGAVSSENVLLEGIAPSRRFAAAVDSAIRMVFVRVMTANGLELLGLKAHEDSARGLELLFRVSMPVQAAMIQGWDGQGVWVLAGRGDGVEAIRLGEQPPRFRPGPPGGQIRADHLSFWTRRCHWPTGAAGAAALALHAVIKDEPRSAMMTRIEQAKREGNVDRILQLSHALELSRHAGEASRLVVWASDHFPDHPACIAAEARSMANLEAWPRVRDLLISLDPSALDDGTAQHVHHMLGAALLHLGEPDKALQVLTRGATYADGRCELSTLIALCTPLPELPGDPMACNDWDDDQALVRLLMSATHATDACLQQGDTTGARRFIDRWEILHAAEVQSLARLAEVYLLGAEVAEDERFDKALVLATFCAAHAQKMVLIRRELPLVHNRWSWDKLDDVSARATRWLETHLGEPPPVPPGGF